MTAIDINSFMFRKRRGAKYNCLHFVEEVWLAATGKDLRGNLIELYNSSLLRSRDSLRKTCLTRLTEPKSPCLVFMTQLGRNPHIGVYIDGMILHLHQGGPEYFPEKLATRGFTSIRYYA